LDKNQSLLVHSVREPEERWERAYSYVLDVEVVSRDWIEKAGPDIWEPNKGYVTAEDAFE
jgi:hypothetical protein